ncbi:MAG: NAD(P)/FAD-dependent oxidoreductase [Actinomycetota bacterium]
MSRRSNHDVPRPADRSWWLEEALAHPEFADPPAPPLDHDIGADGVILGGGYTGLWTAWFLKQLEPEADVVILEQDICGGGPSGRNGGFVNSFWGYVDEAVDLFGDRRGIELCLACEEAVKDIGAFCADNDVDAWYTPAGDIGIATSPAQEGRWRDTVDTAARLGYGDRLVELDAAAVADLVRSPMFGSAMNTTDAATVQPARLARGLRRLLIEHGVHIYEWSPVRRFRGRSPAVAETPNGSVTAGRAVVALNAWGASWPVFSRRIAVRGTYMVVSAPAPQELEKVGWTSGVAVWNFRSAVNYLRTTNDGRIAFGTGGMQPGFGRRIGPRFRYDRRYVAVVAEQFRQWFPSFANVPLEAAWGGPIDVSSTHLPFFGTLPGGGVHYGFGYTGNGVGPSHLGGRILARLALAVEDDDTRLPVVDMEPKPFPREPLKSLGIRVVNAAILRKDAAEDAGREPDGLTSFLAHLPRRLGYRLGP